jgi:nucleoprotein TPR
MQTSPTLSNLSNPNLSARIAEQDATYASEVAGLRRLIEMIEAREAQSKAIVENVEQEWAAVNDLADRRESALREQVERERLCMEPSEWRTSRRSSRNSAAVRCVPSRD